jgi:hypothetical protein
MGVGIRDLVFTGSQRAWEELFVERYRMWQVRVVGIAVQDYAVAMIDPLQHPVHSRRRFCVAY